MARRRRRARVPLGFGAGGRAALISSLLPTASEKAERERAKRAADSQKIAAFNREEISLGELEAYFNERLSQETDAVTKTEIEGLLANAKAADKKRQDAQVGTDAKQAIGDFQSGNASYEATKEALAALKERAVDPELKESIDRLIRDAGQMNTQREVNTRIEEYNKGRLSYTDLADYLERTAASTENTVLRDQLAKAQDMARQNENNKVMTDAQAAYKAGRITIEEFTQRLDALRKDPSQTDPETLEKIATMIGVAEANEQAIIDHKTYIAWQTGTMSDDEAYAYFQGRLAADRTAQGAETLGKYTTNIKSAMEQKVVAAGKGAATVRAAQQRADTSARTYAQRVNSSVPASVAASAAATRTAVKTAFADYDKDFNTMVAAARGDVTTILALYKDRARVLSGYALKVGLSAEEYGLLLQENSQAATVAVATSQWQDYTEDVKRITAEYLSPKAKADTNETKTENASGIEVLGSNVPGEQYVEGSLRIAQRARMMMDNPYALPGQKEDAYATRTAWLSFAHRRLQSEQAVATQAIGAFEGSVKNAWNDATPMFRAKYKDDFAAFDKAVREDPRGVLGAAFLASNQGKSAQDADAYVNSVVANLNTFDRSRVTVAIDPRSGAVGSTALGRLNVETMLAQDFTRKDFSVAELEYIAKGLDPETRAALQKLIDNAGPDGRVTRSQLQGAAPRAITSGLDTGRVGDTLEAKIIQFAEEAYPNSMRYMASLQNEAIADAQLGIGPANRDPGLWRKLNPLTGQVEVVEGESTGVRGTRRMITDAYIASLNQPFIIPESRDEPEERLLVTDPVSLQPVWTSPFIQGKIQPAAVPTVDENGNPRDPAIIALHKMFAELGSVTFTTSANIQRGANWLGSVVALVNSDIKEAEQHAAGVLGHVAGTVAGGVGATIGELAKSFIDPQDVADFRDTARPERAVVGAVQNIGAAISETGVWKTLANVWQSTFATAGGVRAAELGLTPIADVSENQRDLRDREALIQDLINTSSGRSWDTAEDQNTLTGGIAPTPQYPEYNPDWSMPAIQMPTMQYPEYNPDWNAVIDPGYIEPPQVDQYVYQPQVTPGYQAPNYEENQPWVPPTYTYNPVVTPTYRAPNVEENQPWEPPSFQLPTGWDSGGGGSSGGGGGTDIYIQD